MKISLNALVLAQQHRLQPHQLQQRQEHGRSAPAPTCVWLSSLRSATGRSSIISRRVRNWIICATVTASSSTLKVGPVPRALQNVAKDAHQVDRVGGDLRLQRAASSFELAHPGIGPGRRFQQLLLLQHLRGVLEALMLQQPLHQLAARIFARIVRADPRSRGSSILLLMWISSDAM